MGFSISVDWQEDWKNNPEKWENYGRMALEDGCNHKTQDDSTRDKKKHGSSGYCEECGFFEDSAVPMMNYAYPLHNSYDFQ